MDDPWHVGWLRRRRKHPLGCGRSAPARAGAWPQGDPAESRRRARRPEPMLVAPATPSIAGSPQLATLNQYPSACNCAEPPSSRRALDEPGVSGGSHSVRTCSITRSASVDSLARPLAGPGGFGTSDDATGSCRKRRRIRYSVDHETPRSEAAAFVWRSVDLSPSVRKTLAMRALRASGSGSCVTRISLLVLAPNYIGAIFDLACRVGKNFEPGGVSPCRPRNRPRFGTK